MFARRLSRFLALGALVLGLSAPPAFGSEEQSPKKCNAGNGNGSDPVTFVEGAHCFGGDPGNSYNAGNKGGDEIPSSGGVPNPRRLSPCA